MNKMDRMGFLINFKKNKFQKLVAKTSKVIEEWLEKCQSPCVAFSGGKDSTVLLHLVRNIKNDVTAMFSDDEYHLPETIDLINNTDNLIKIASHVQHTDWFWSWEKKDNLPNDVEWIETKGDASTEWAKKNGYDGMAVGLRSEENFYRRIAIRKHGKLFFVKKKQLWQCWPLADWKVEDVWTAIVGYNIPYNKAYDKLSSLGVPLLHQRIGPFANQRAIGYGQLSILKHGWPAEFDKFVKNHPEAMEWL